MFACANPVYPVHPCRMLLLSRTTTTATRSILVGCGYMTVKRILRAARTGIPAAELVEDLGGAGEPVEPDPERSALCEERFETYRKLYPALRPLDIS